MHKQIINTVGFHNFLCGSTSTDEYLFVFAPYFRAATAGKAPKAWALPRFWVSIRSYKKQPVKKKIGVEYWALPGSNSQWRPS